MRCLQRNHARVHATMIASTKCSISMLRGCFGPCHAVSMPCHAISIPMTCSKKVLACALDCDNFQVLGDNSSDDDSDASESKRRRLAANHDSDRRSSFSMHSGYDSSQEDQEKNDRQDSRKEGPATSPLQGVVAARREPSGLASESDDSADETGEDSGEDARKLCMYVHVRGCRQKPSSGCVGVLHKFKRMQGPG